MECCNASEVSRFKVAKKDKETYMALVDSLRFGECNSLPRSGPLKALVFGCFPLGYDRRCGAGACRTYCRAMTRGTTQNRARA